MKTVYYSGDWATDGIKKYTISEEDYARGAVWLPGARRQPVPRTEIFDTLEEACAAASKAIMAQVADLDAQKVKLEARLASLSGTTVVVKAVSATVDVSETQDIAKLAAALAK